MEDTGPRPTSKGLRRHCALYTQCATYRFTKLPPHGTIGVTKYLENNILLGNELKIANVHLIVTTNKAAHAMKAGFRLPKRPEPTVVESLFLNYLTEIIKTTPSCDSQRTLYAVNVE